MEHLENNKKITIMLTILVSMLFSSLSQTIVDTALPRIVSDLGGMDYYTWIYTIYMLATSIMVILVGKLSDIYGRKVFLLSGIAVFMLGAFLSGTSTSMVQLIIYRGLQGVGGGTIMSASMTTVADLFSPAERGKWQGVMGGVFGLSSVIGPTLGGYVVDHWAWHWIFWIFLPLGLVALVFIYVLYPKHEKQGEKEKVDYLGALFLVMTLIPLLLGFTWAGTKYDWGSTQIFSLFSIAIVGVVLFLFAESKVANPILPLQLFKNSIFSISNLMGFLIGMGMFGSIMFIPLFVQGVIGSSATQSGVVLMPMTLSLVVASAISGQITSRTGKYKYLAVIGTTIVAIGMYLLSRMNIHTTNSRVTINMIILGSGMGIIMPLFVLTVQNAVDKKLLGVATSAVQLFRQIGGTVGVSIMGTIMNHSMNNNLTKEITPDAQSLLSKVGLDHINNPQVLFDPKRIEQIKAMIPPQSMHVFEQVLATIRDSLAVGIRDVFFYGFLLMALNIGIVFFLKEIPLRKSMDEEHHNSTNSELLEQN
ncbi:MDR family MFS transporter [Tepidibacillus marianensis]|uniref:MDR family MFS transporter n=1 Tax=Tepidibacillus marianensis TaxID=3131995 RepID=UPI0030CA5EB6